MKARWLAAAAVGLALGSTRCAPPLLPAAAPRTIPANGPDLTARNLPPDEEIAALLAGLPDVGTPSSPAVRIAVAPFAVPGAPALAWVGEAASEVVGERLAVIAGVSVLRRDEVGRTSAEMMRAGVAGDDGLAAELGRSLGVQHVVYGRATPDGEDRFSLVVRVVSVATGAGREAASATLTRSDLAGTAGRAAAAVGEAFGATGGADLGLSTASLETATRAQTLHRDGKLLEALPLYAGALASPSRAFRLETDFARMMIDLGLEQDGSKRAREVLGRVPASVDAACVRAGLMLEAVRDRWDVGETRDAVRTAASCGDGALTALALRHYAGSVDDRHYPTMTAALARAHALVQATPGAWGACWVEMHRYFRQADNGDWQGRRDTHLVQIAEACETAGNARIESLTLRVAADWCPDAKRRLELYEQAEGTVGPLSGSMADAAVIAAASELRQTGRVKRADDKLRAAIGVRLRALVDLYGGLPAPLDRLDADLLEAAGQASPTSAAPRDPLAAQALRVSVATLLRAWAERTRRDSARRADAYGSIADTLSPLQHAGPPGETLDPWLDRQLDLAKLPMSRIASLTEPPPWGSGANESNAFSALIGWLRRERRRDDQKAREILAAATKVAGWVDEPSLYRQLSLEKCRRLDVHGRHDEAAAEARASLKHAPDDPGWTARALACVEDAIKFTDTTAMLEASARRVEAAKRVSGAAWVEALYWTAYDAVDTRRRDAADLARGLERAAVELEGAEDYAAAAQALSYAGQIASMGDHFSTKQIALARARIPIVDRLGDDARSLEARVDVLEAVRQHYHGGWPKPEREYVAAAPEVRAGMPDVRSRAEALVDAGRPLDAARQVARIPLGAPGLLDLSRAAFAWVKDGDDLPGVLAPLYIQRGLSESSREARRDAFAKARELYRKAGDTPSAVAAAQRVIAEATVEADLWAALDACNEAGKRDPLQANFCIDAAMDSLYGFGPERVRDLARVRALFAKGVSAMREATVDNAGFRYQHRAKLAEIAALAGDWDEAQRLDAEVEAESRADASQRFPYAQHLARLATYTAARDLKRALAVCHRFDLAGAAAPVWIASQYVEFADIARRAGDETAVALYETKGREAARRANREWLPYYELNLVKQALRKKDWRAAAKGYLLAAETQKKEIQTDHMGPGENEAAAAQALLYARDTKAANALLDPMVKHVERQLKGGIELFRPCFEAGVVGLAAASRMAAGQCDEGERLRALSAKVRAMCKTEVCYPTSDDGNWCDNPGRLTGKMLDNACHAPVPIDASTLPHAP